ncbi:MAG: hydrogenase-4 component G [Desulfamplus sp.]|nr:hydrogenase-4 component G [Desulfamplus sp.]
MKKFSGTVKNTYDNSEGNKMEKDLAFNVMMSSFKVKVSSNTYENLNDQGSFFEKSKGSSASGSYSAMLISSKSSKGSVAHPFAPSSSTSSDKPGDLFGEDGYWGVKKTAGRISDFVLSGAGDDIEKLKAGREGIQRGLKDAEKVWGGKMPDLAYETIDKSIEAIDEKIKKLGGNIVDISA